ncbi:hypothetical protein [Flagellimonas sp.]|uniref:hypothetical protein n=1 Tax=Flagellimonas sp. TaxID=2058762 RepID=UPI003B5987B0
MRIKLGTYSLKIKSFSAGELGLKGAENLSFNIYQKVFHFWYIPIFPVEKHWKIKDKETKKEFADTTPEMRSAINLKMLKKRSPIWSYAGSIVLALPILFLLGYVIYGAVDVSAENIGKSWSKNSRISAKEDLVEIPEIDDRYTFKVIEVEAVTDMNGHIAKYQPSPYFSPQKMDFMVNYVSKDSVGFDFVEDQGFVVYGDDVKKEFRLSKKALLGAIKGYKNLNILKRPNEEGSKTKKLAGIFQIKRPENLEEEN